MSTELASFFSYFFMIFSFSLLMALAGAARQGQLLTDKAGISGGGK